MSLGAPAHSLNLQTNINASRYFFATQEAGEQELFLSTLSGGGFTGNISSLAVGISGSAGNAVIVSEAPTFIASEFMAADQGIAVAGSQYWTLSTLSTSITGLNLSYDRASGSGTAVLESYAGNGAVGGFELLCRGLDSQLLSTTSVGTNLYLSSLGNPGSTAKLNSQGVLTTSVVQGAVVNSVDEATGGSGRACFKILDLSGAGGAQPQQRWAIGTAGIPTGGDVGSDLAIFAYDDTGAYIGNAVNFERATQATEIYNISSVAQKVSSTSIQVYPINSTNQPYQPFNKVAPIAGFCNQGGWFAPLFSTPIIGANPVGKTFVSINWEHALSTQSNLVNYKVMFSTTDSPNNTGGLISEMVPGVGGTWNSSNLPGVSTPVAWATYTGCLEPYGVNPDGSAFLYVYGAFAQNFAPADTLFIAKETTFNAATNRFAWRAM